jgi:DNA modification methylase
MLLHGTDEHSYMLDPFLGIGSAGIAAKQQRIGRFVGFEIDPGYLKTARERIDS